MNTSVQKKESGLRNALLLFGMIGVGLALNFLGSQINSLFGLPFYIDNIGTILIAAIGGYLPCIAVGFFYNIIAAVSSPMSEYYCFISVLIAFAAAFFAALNNGRVSSILSLTRTIVFQTAAVYLLPVLLGQSGIWLSVSVAEILSLGVSVWFAVGNGERYGYLNHRGEKA